MVDHDLGLSKIELQQRANGALDAVELSERVGDMYPHELSGGMNSAPVSPSALS
jgi:ABC-type transporter Mla maintaining outer membrane lipid asymmetry ATPase subunit MlaF